MNYQNLFRSLLKKHYRLGLLRDHRIQKILGDLPLERLFNEEQLQRFILTDSPILFFYRDEQNVRTISAPHMISMMISMLELDPFDKVLILGSKGGLIEGTIAKVVGDVIIVEQHEEVASITEEAFIKLGIKNLWVHRQNPMFGMQKEALFTKILITGAIPFIPHILINQLSDNGIIVAPLMLNHPNHQSIFQIIKHPTENEIINFGNVIFAPLFYKELPRFDTQKDISFEKIILDARQDKKENLLEQKEFFKEFLKLPRVEFHNLTFTKTNELYLSIPQKIEKIEKNQIYTIQTSGKEKETIINNTHLQILLFNPSIFPIEVSFEFNFPCTNEKGNLLGITLNPQTPIKIKFPLKIPLFEGSHILRFVCIGLKKYRISHGYAYIHTMKNVDEKKWEFSIEFN